MTWLIQAPPGARGLVDEIVERLISKFSPRRIYLFGSRARADAHADSDYDFLIEVDALPPDIALTQGMMWLRDFPRTEVQVHVRSPDGFERKKDDPGTVDWDVVREGILLFALEDLPAMRAGAAPNMVREGARKPPRSLGGWLRHADEHMRGSQGAAAPISGDIEPPVTVTEAQARRAFAIAERIEAAVRARLR
ncbi:MAG: nucleotidyltransferase domain-containing protein [Gemmatimonadaceae bacterium]